MGNNQNKNENNIKFNKEELKILYQNFQNLDTDKSGSIEPWELFNVPELKENPIVQRIITVFDKNNDGKISFYEFVIGLSSLTNSGNQEEKLKIAFQIYDMNNDGYISNGDLFNLLKILVGENLTNIQLQQLVDRTIIAADKDLDGKVGYEEFCEFVQDMKIDEMFSLNIFHK
jgi:serine/threonine-protein phosphatase 2B regulatory subunit